MPPKSYSVLDGTRYASLMWDYSNSLRIARVEPHPEEAATGFAEDQVYLGLGLPTTFSASLSIDSDELYRKFRRLAGLEDLELMPYQEVILRECLNKKEERHMKMSEEMALWLHLMMWGDMKKALGDCPSVSARKDFKEKWVSDHFPGASVMHNCFLCEYSCDGDSCSGKGCSRCPIVWDAPLHEVGATAPCEVTYKVSYTRSLISKILALPARNPELQHIVDEFNTKDPDKCGREAYLSVRVSQLEEEVNELRKTLAEVREFLADESGLAPEQRIGTHIEEIKDMASDEVLRSFYEKMGSPDDMDCSSVETIVKYLIKKGFDRGYALAKDTVLRCVGIDGLNRDHSFAWILDQYEEKIIEQYKKNHPEKAPTPVSVDVDQAFKQYADEAVRGVKEKLAKASGLSAGDTTNNHIEAIESKADREGYRRGYNDCKKNLAFYSGRTYDHSLLDHVTAIREKKAASADEEIKKALHDGYMTCLKDLWRAAGCPDEPFKDALGAHARIEGYARNGYVSNKDFVAIKEALSNASGYSTSTGVNVHIKAIYCKGAADARKTMEEKITDIFKK